jgi:phospholipase/carboxylesterase
MEYDNPHLRHALEPWGAPAPAARIAVLAVHGRDQDPEFMQDLSARLSCSGARFYGARADGRSWYPRPFMEPIPDNQPRLDYAMVASVGAAMEIGDEGLDAAMVAIAPTIATIGNEGFEPARIVLWGFSQGGCLLSHFIVKHQPRMAGAILFTGGYIGPGPLAVPSGRPLAGVPVLVRSIEDDPFVPRGRVEDTAELLRSAGALVDAAIAPGTEHIITAEATDAGGALLDRLSLDPPGGSSPGG